MKRSILRLVCLFAPVVLVLSMSDALAADTEQAKPDPVPADKPIAEYQLELLDIAMNAANQVPRRPLIKKRSSLQHTVVSAALELGQPSRAIDYFRKIDNWRQGAAMSEYVLYLAENEYDLPTMVEKYTRLSKAHAAMAEQNWHRETIALNIAKARMVMGDLGAGKEFIENSTEHIHDGVIEVFQAETDEDQSYEYLSKRFDLMLKSGRMEPIINGAVGYAALYKRVYKDEPKRKAIEEKVEKAYAVMDGRRLIELYCMLAEAAASHGDKANALRFVDACEKKMPEMNWPTSQEYEFVTWGLILETRYKVGDKQGAFEKLDAITERATNNIENVVNIWRADTLRPLAEAYSVMGKTDRALEIYEQAIERGTDNPNSWPRANDLGKTCVSMALHGVKPTDKLAARIRTIAEELGAPW